MTITERIFMILLQKKLSQKDFAKKIDVNEKTVSAWKKNNSLPPLDKISNISDCSGVSIDFLLTREEKNSPTAELTADEQELLTYYNELQDIDKGRVLGTAKILAELTSSVADKPTVEEEPDEQETIFIEFATHKASAGTGEQLTDDPEGNFIEVVKNDTTLQAKFAIQIHGDSMEPEYNNGDIVLVKAKPQINTGQIGIFTVNDMGYIKKPKSVK